MSRSRRSRKKNAQRPSPEEFLAALECNEDMMGEGAAMAVTCEMYGLDWTEGHELLMEHPEAEESA